MKPLKIIFQMDGTGIIMNPYEPVHLDSLLSYAACSEHLLRTGLERNEIPEVIELPLKKWAIENTWGWYASALFPAQTNTESLQYWRKKFRLNRINYTVGSPNLASGKYREYNAPMPLTLCKTITAYAYGYYEEIQKLLKKIKYIGKKGIYGKGRVLGYQVNYIDNDLSIYDEQGFTMRFLPQKDGKRIGRIRPPYWNRTELVKSCFVNQKRLQ